MRVTIHTTCLLNRFRRQEKAPSSNWIFVPTEHFAQFDFETKTPPPPPTAINHKFNFITPFFFIVFFSLNFIFQRKFSKQYRKSLASFGCSARSVEPKEVHLSRRYWLVLGSKCTLITFMLMTRCKMRCNWLRLRRVLWNGKKWAEHVRHYCQKIQPIWRRFNLCHGIPRVGWTLHALKPPVYWHANTRNFASI